MVAKYFHKNIFFKPLLIWFSISIILLAVYYPARSMCVFDDVMNFYSTVKHIGWAGFKNSYHYSSNYYTHNLLMICLYKLFGTNQTYYYIIGCLWHALNASLIYYVFKKCLQNIKIHLPYLPIFTSVLFAFGCLQSENVVYMGTLQYQYVLTILLFGILLFLYWVSSTFKIPKIYFILFYFFYLTGFFAQETCIMYPLVFVVLLWLHIKTHSTQKTWKHFLQKFFLPMFCLVIFYFCWHYFIFKNWLPHYGAEHLKGYTFQNIIQIFTENIFKNIYFILYYKNWFYTLFPNFAKNTFLNFSGWIIFLFISLKIIYNQKVNYFYFAISLIFLFCIFYSTVANFGNYSFAFITNDRLLFFPRIFLYSYLFLFLFCVFKKYYLVSFVLFASINIVLLFITVNQYKHAGKIMQTMHTTFPNNTKDTFFFLNIPNQYNGVFICRYPYSISTMSYLFNTVDITNRYMSIARQNMFNYKYNFSIIKKNDSTIIFLNHASGWLDMDGVEKNDLFKNNVRVKIFDGATGYELSIIKPIKNLQLLYFSNEGFKVFSLAKDSVVEVRN